MANDFEFIIFCYKISFTSELYHQFYYHFVGDLLFGFNQTDIQDQYADELKQLGMFLKKNSNWGTFINSYCKLFNSIEKGGITFQLLDNEYLRDTYCENCRENTGQNL